MKKFILTIALFLGGVGFAQAQQAQIIAVAAIDRTENSNNLFLLGLSKARATKK